MSTSEITRLLHAWGRGDPQAFNELVPLVYSQLRSLAARQLRRSGANQTLTTTAVVHEAYLKLVDGLSATPLDRQHFFAVAARAMRQILVDRARRRVAQKRGGRAPHTGLEEGRVPALTNTEEVLALEEALGRLEALDPRLGRLVELRFFGGLSVEETAGALELSPRTVKRDWRKARAYLHRELAGAA